jgi:hypothetical protein
MVNLKLQGFYAWGRLVNIVVASTQQVELIYGETFHFTLLCYGG